MAMRYHFDVCDGDSFYPDEEGLDLPSLEQVQEAAARALADMAREWKPFEDPAHHRLSVAVRDDYGPIFELAFTLNVERHRN